MASSTSRWESFFKEAGIPSKLAKDYASTFNDNRMRLDMLDELSKELLHDLGITAVGDTISILRHAKKKHKEMARLSPSSEEEVIEQPPPPKKSKPTSQTAKTKTTTITKPTTQQTKTKNTSTSNITQSNKEPSLRIQAPKDTGSSTSKQKERRKKLSDRFDNMEQIVKKKKEEEIAEQKQKQKDVEEVASKPKTQGTTFTVQMSSKKTPSTTTKKLKEQKVTLVPAQGKTLNRKKQPSSIFDRLEKSQTTTSSPYMDQAILKKKQTVFNRLGDQTSEPQQKIQKVSAMSRLDTTTPPSSSSCHTTTTKQTINISKQQQISRATQQQTHKPTTSNVFNRLGDR